MYNRSEIMRTANGYAKIMSRSDALRMAWNEAKMVKIHERAAEMSARFPNAFMEKYPGGTLVKGDYKGYTYIVSFTPGGKSYTYRGGCRDVAQKLGLNVNWAA